MLTISYIEGGHGRTATGAVIGRKSGRVRAFVGSALEKAVLQRVVGGDSSFGVVIEHARN